MNTKQKERKKKTKMAAKVGGFHEHLVFERVIKLQKLLMKTNVARFIDQICQLSIPITPKRWYINGKKEVGRKKYGM
jgi:hypothetical protein